MKTLEPFGDRLALAAVLARGVLYRLARRGEVNRWRASLEKRGHDVSARRLPTVEEAEHGVFLEDAEREVRELTRTD